jgi:adenosylcobinamide-GDP ribazoletransferase
MVGGLHIDGISDVFDGIFSARTKDRMLVIMEDSRIGAFGAVGLILYFMSFYVGILEVSRLDQAWVFILCMPIVGRSMALIAAGLSSYAKEDGMAKALIDTIKPRLSFLLIISFCVGAYILSLHTFISIAMTIILMLWILKAIHKRLDGITGDVIGLMVEVSQVLFLICISIFVR